MQIFYTTVSDSLVGFIHSFQNNLMNSYKQVQEDMRNGQIALEKYIITKSLTKPPEAYPDARSQPHVEVSNITESFVMSTSS